MVYPCCSKSQQKNWVPSDVIGCRQMHRTTVQSMPSDGIRTARPTAYVKGALRTSADTSADRSSDDIFVHPDVRRLGIGGRRLPIGCRRPPIGRLPINRTSARYQFLRTSDWPSDVSGGVRRRPIGPDFLLCIISSCQREGIATF